MAALEQDIRVSPGIWALLALVASVSLVSWAVTGMGLKPAQLAGLLAVTAVLMGASAFYSLRRPDPRLATLLRASAEILLLAVLVGALSYSATALARPLWDETFHAWDQALGFNWRFWLGVVNDHPTLHLCLVAAYHSMLPQTVLAVVALATMRAYRPLNTYVLAYGLAALSTVAIAAFMPALSPLVHYGIAASEHPNIVLAVPLEFQEHALALREGRMKMVDLSGAQGLVTFPSFHTVSAILLMLAFWAVPYLRWVSLALNALMLLAIPIEGSHYLVDVIAGTALALAAWVMASWITRRERPISVSSLWAVPAAKSAGEKLRRLPPAVPAVACADR